MSEEALKRPVVSIDALRKSRATTSRMAQERSLMWSPGMLAVSSCSPYPSQIRCRGGWRGQRALTARGNL